MRAALDEHARRLQVSPNPERLRSALRRAGGRPRALPRVRRARRQRLRAGALRGRVRPGRGSVPALELDGGGCGCAGRIDRIDVDAGGREAIVYDYKGKTATAQAKLARGGQAADRALHAAPCASCSGSSRSAASTSRSAATEPRPRGRARGRRPGAAASFGTDRVATRSVGGAAGRVRRRGARGRRRDPRRARCEPRPRPLRLARRLRAIPRSAAA